MQEVLVAKGHFHRHSIKKRLKNMYLTTDSSDFESVFNIQLQTDRIFWSNKKEKKNVFLTKISQFSEFSLKQASNP